MARKSKLTPELQATIVETLRLGCPISTAAAAAGITERTLYNWLERGEATTHGQYFQFFQAVREARTIAEVTAMQSWRAGMLDDWRAAVAFLERLHPEKYALAKDRGEGDQAREVFVMHYGQVSRQEWEQLAQAQQQQHAAPSGETNTGN